MLLAGLAWHSCKATEHEELVSQALAAVNGDFRDTWAFSETSVVDNTAYVATCDPRRPRDARWVLVSVDAKPPSDDERASFLEEKAKDDEKQSAVSSISVRLSGWLVAACPRSSSSDSADYWLLCFMPAPDAGDEDFMQHVDGRLRIVKGGEYLESLSLENTSPFKPALGVKISRFETRLRFGPAGDADNRQEMVPDR